MDGCALGRAAISAAPYLMYSLFILSAAFHDLAGWELFAIPVLHARLCRADLEGHPVITVRKKDYCDKQQRQVSLGWN